MVCRIKKLTDAVTIPIMQRHTRADKEMQLVEDIKHGRLRKELEHSVSRSSVCRKKCS